MKLQFPLASLIAVTLLTAPAWAQDTNQGSELPQVEVIQDPPIQQQSQPTQSSPPPQQTTSAPAAEDLIEPLPPTDDFAGSPATTNAPPTPGSVYGVSGSSGAAARANQAAQSPVNPKQITPTDLQGFSEAATNVSAATLDERRPRNRNEIFTRVPGVTVINDDGNANHGGLAARGSAARRSRKLLVMEDGVSVNLALWLDPSVHYMAPVDRIESVEVIRGGSVLHGPNNNFGIVNVRLLSPFGPNETVVSGALGWTEPNGGDGGLYGVSNRRHVHTRQTFGNVGIVAAYSGADVDGAWDQERLRFNDFYGALGWAGTNQDLTLQLTVARQRDVYDESNLEGEEEDGEPGEVERDFFALNHCKTCFAPGSIFNNYNGDIIRGQVLHNWYLNRDTTITSRVYAKRHTRDRYQIVTTEDNPAEAEDPGLRAVFEDDDDLFNVLIPEDSMFGRLRTFQAVGGEIRTEFANVPLMAGMTQDIQMGFRYEYQDMTNRNFIGLSGQFLEDGDEKGLTIFERNLQADTFSTYIQSAMHVTSDVTLVPGVRFEWARISRNSLVTAEEEGEAEELEDDPECEEIATGLDDCLEVEGINRDPFTEEYDTGNILPGITFAYTGFNKTTVYGGYHRGWSTGVLRNEQFPAPDELGDNYNIGVRSTAITGFGFDVAYFHSEIKNYQFGQAFASTAGDRAFGRADELEINGVEMLGRFDSNPLHGGEWNLFGEANYTYQRAIFKKGTTGFREDEDDPIEQVSIAGFRAPEIPLHVAALTVGLGQQPDNGWDWDASVTWTYRGAFFTDELNTPFGGDAEGENGKVPDVWLLSARANLKIGDTGASVWVSGENLTDELYITDREDGLKPGQARTFWAGARFKF